MFESNIKKILLFIFLKYLVFYLVMMFKNGNYALISLNELKTTQDVFYYLWIFFFLPILISILFVAPLNYAFMAKRGTIFIAIIVSFFILEYFIYIYLASQANLINGILNTLVGLIIFIILFYKTIFSRLKI